MYNRLNSLPNLITCYNHIYNLLIDMNILYVIYSHVGQNSKSQKCIKPFTILLHNIIFCTKYLDMSMLLEIALVWLYKDQMIHLGSIIIEWCHGLHLWKWNLKYFFNHSPVHYSNYYTWSLLKSVQIFIYLLILYLKKNPDEYLKKN